jgi:hypothetical protein
VDPGRVLRVKLLQLSNSYGSVTRLDNLFGDNPFTVAPIPAPTPFATYALAQALASEADGVIASFVDADELGQFLPLVTLDPVFVSLAQNEQPTTFQSTSTASGDATWMWVDRGIAFGPECLDAADCGVVLPPTIDCLSTGTADQGVWSRELCDFLNVQNVLYEGAAAPHCDQDGSMAASCSPPDLSFIATSTGTWLGYVWFSGANPTSTACSATYSTSRGFSVAAFTCAVNDHDTITYAYNGAAIFESQLFPPGYTTRISAYPYPGL